MIRCLTLTPIAAEIRITSGRSPQRRGGRFYVTKNPEAADLIEAVPAGFEVVEYPYDAKVVIRKKVPVWVTKEEMAVVQEAMEEHSPVRDFIVVAEKGAIGIYISQFSHYF